MARKESITRDILSEGAFKLLREQGAEMLTARKLASFVGCSTQPIFRIYDGMEDLNSEMFAKSRKFYEEFCGQYVKKSNVPFVDLALCYIAFAKAEPNLFKILFLSSHDDENTMYDIINGKENGFVIKELRRIPNLDMNNAGMIFMKVFVFMHGMACMVINGEFDLDEAETEKMLVEVIASFIS